MIECIFTIDYEIYGNGEGSLRELVYDPAEALAKIFKKKDYRFVAFIEAAELEMIDEKETDRDIDRVKHQIRDLFGAGFELGLHLHPQWYNARFENGKWLLDHSEYNLSTLSIERISQIVERSINYLRNILDEPDFTPISFRAGNWLFQPTQAVAKVLVGHGVKVDSSVFKGGLQHQHKLDYRRALRNGYYWTFSDNVEIPDPHGNLLELPTYSQMVPFWRMLTAKRIGMQRKSSSHSKRRDKKLHRLHDLLRFRYPLKLDYCRMTLEELIHMMESVIREDQENPSLFRPIVAIGHTKDLTDVKTIEALLNYLGEKGIPISTFENVYQRCKH
jgi:hypothetical protein